MFRRLSGISLLVWLSVASAAAQEASVMAHEADAITEGHDAISGAKSIAKDGFELRKVNDSLYWLNDWHLPYPVYQFQTGDVDGDGSIDAMVGVVKSTRFYPEKGRRLFIFKQVNGKARPMWMGSKLGGILEDFRFSDGKIRALESTADSLYVVSDYRWGGFGMRHERFIIKGTDKQTALKTFSQ